MLRTCHFPRFIPGDDVLEMPASFRGDDRLHAILLPDLRQMVRPT